MRFLARVQAPIIFEKNWSIAKEPHGCGRAVAGEFAEQAVTLQAFDGDRQHLSDDVG